jgi:uncharacterized protein YuzE
MFDAARSVNGVPIRPTDERWLHIVEARDERKGMAQIAEWESKDFARIIKAVPRLMEFPAKQLWIDYDAEADVLYLSFAKPQKATDSELRDDGIIVHRRGKKVVDLTIQDASTR